MEINKILPKNRNSTQNWFLPLTLQICAAIGAKFRRSFLWWFAICLQAIHVPARAVWRNFRTGQAPNFLYCHAILPKLVFSVLPNNAPKFVESLDSRTDEWTKREPKKSMKNVTKNYIKTFTIFMMKKQRKNYNLGKI